MTHCFSSQASSWNESVTIWKRSFLSFEWLSQGRCSCVVPPATFSCLFTLGMASPQQKAFCVLEFAKTNSVVTVQRAFWRRFDINPPSPKNIRRWFRQFQESGCLCKGKVQDDHESGRNSLIALMLPVLQVVATLNTCKTGNKSWLWVEYLWLGWSFVLLFLNKILRNEIGSFFLNNPV